MSIELANLAGNLEEWVLDYYEPTTYQDRSDCDNCAVIEGRNRAVREGSYVYDASSLRAAARMLGGNEFLNSDTLGFRCARDP